MEETNQEDSIMPGREKTRTQYHQIKNVFQEEWGQHVQTLGVKVKVKMENWHRYDIDSVYGAKLWHCGCGSRKDGRKEISHLSENI